MMLGFQRRFAPFVLDGSKTHTIRAIRKIPPKVGETCHCYVDPRQKTMRLLGRWPCVKVETISIEKHWAGGAGCRPVIVCINGHRLDQDEIDRLFYRDGFRNTTFPAQEAFGFWKDRLPFHGHIIHWSRPHD